MAEAEDVITDVARHATVFMQELWRRHRPVTGAPQVALADVQARLDLLANAVFGRPFRLRPAQPPAPRTWLDKLARRRQAPPAAIALPATDGASIWLPRSLAGAPAAALERYRVLLLVQAMRAVRGSARHAPATAVELAVYRILEADLADADLLRRMPGIAPALTRLRQQALAARPAPAVLAPVLRPIEQLLQDTLRGGIADADGCTAALARARDLVSLLPPPTRAAQGRIVLADLWLGELRPPAAEALADEAAAADACVVTPRSARLARRPEARQPRRDEDAASSPGPSMVQTAQPHEQAEDPMGLQRPTDRDTQTAAEEFADALSELPQARLVRTPGTPPEVLLTDDTPDRLARAATAMHAESPVHGYRYPEWDWQAGQYADNAATVFVHPAIPGAQAGVDAILHRHGATLHEVRRRFEMLRAQRTRLCRQLDGDDVDLQAWIDSRALLRASGKLDQRLYQSERRGRRSLAVTLLVDTSGSTDGWLTDQRRVIDVEREALLLVCVALDGLDEPFSVLGFSGEGPHGVVVRTIKRFEERYGSQVALRIAGLEPERFTRVGAALRHATAALMTQAAEHRLLIVLSDGRPNDVDRYDGRYGIEDLRQAVTEARLQGIAPFCLTIDRQAANYLPAVFGAQGYALLPRAELLPRALLQWLQRLVAR